MAAPAPASNVLGPVTSLDNEFLCLHASPLCKRLVFLHQLREKFIGPIGWKPFVSHPVKTCENPNELLRISIGQRTQQNRIDRAEDRRVRSDAEREREHGYEGEAGILEQLAESEAKV